MLNKGYATTMNLHLAMLHALIYIDHQAGGITDDSEIQRIRTLRGYGVARILTSSASVITFPLVLV